MKKAEITDVPIRPGVWGPPRPPKALGLMVQNPAF